MNKLTMLLAGLILALALPTAAQAQCESCYMDPDLTVRCLWDVFGVDPCEDNPQGTSCSEANGEPCFHEDFVAAADGSVILTSTTLAGLGLAPAPGLEAWVADAGSYLTRACNGLVLDLRYSIAEGERMRKRSAEFTL